MIGLLLPFWLNLGGGGAPAPVHHDAPGERYLMCDEGARVMCVDGEQRTMSVESDSREMPC